MTLLFAMAILWHFIRCHDWEWSSSSAQFCCSGFRTRTYWMCLGSRSELQEFWNGRELTVLLSLLISPCTVQPYSTWLQTFPAGPVLSDGWTLSIWVFTSHTFRKQKYGHSPIWVSIIEHSYFSTKLVL